VANGVIQRAWSRLRVAGAIAPGTAAAERFGSFGPGSVIAFPTATLYGEGSIHVGAGTMVSTWSTLAAGYSPDQDTVPPRALVIGDRCVIGMRSGIVAHESIEIGDDVWFGQEVYVTDANHGYQDPETPIGRQLGPHQSVVIGSGSWIGHGSVVLPGARIGRNVVVAAGSVVRGDIPDHAVVGGVPAKVIRRYDADRAGWVRDGDDAADDGADVRPRSQTIPPEDLARALASLEADPLQPTEPAGPTEPTERTDPSTA
jgi:acetyltransferase-like isoleucine patch superfamily enzyme